MTSRPLTNGEIKLAKSVFGDSIDYAVVKISDSPFIFFQALGSGMAPNGNLYMYGCYSTDYAAEDPHSRSHFIHEMAHVWQFQNKILHPVAAFVELTLQHKFNYMAAYPFHLDGRKDLTEYGMEQQASIVQEYFMAKHEGLISHARFCKNACNDNERLELYEQVLAKFLKDPSYARQDKFPPPRSRKPKP